ncbi:MAG: BofC C-terminal domain-containing protein [Tepidanaerobacteraceae bacterium]|jgi:hypothetical protein|nr:hypothetical protein [Thermoanaerobacterales bacterium]
MPRFFYRYLIIGLCIIIISFGYGYLKTLLSLNNTNGNENSDYLEQNVIQTPQIKLNSKAKLKYITFYMGCGDEIIEEKNIDEKYVGITKSDFQKVESDWIIESFTSEEAVLRREINGICSNHYYIGINNGYVALFQGIPGMQSSLMEQTDILADILREDDRQILEKGLILNDKQEFLKIREGLTN